MGIAQPTIAGCYSKEEAEEIFRPQLEAYAIVRGWSLDDPHVAAMIEAGLLAAQRRDKSRDD